MTKKLDALAALGREFVPGDFTRLSEDEAVYIRRKFSAAADMKSAIKRFVDANPDICTDELKRAMEDWLNVPV